MKILRLSPNELLILKVLKQQRKAIERRILIEKTGISDKNISAKLNALETKELITSERTRKGRTVNRWVQLTKAGKDYKLGKIVIEIKPKPKIKKEEIEDAIAKDLGVLKVKIRPKKPPKPEKIEAKPLPASIELKKELRLLINLVLTHRKEQYKKYGYKSVSEIRAQIDTLIDQLGE